jgi:integrase/recombinase XerD
MATLMLEHGADIRYIQQMLGHADLASTQIYTQVSIRQLQKIHAATHPGAQIEKAQASDQHQEQDEQLRADLLAALDAEAEEE